MDHNLYEKMNSAPLGHRYTQHREPPVPGQLVLDKYSASGREDTEKREERVDLSEVSEELKRFEMGRRAGSVKARDPRSVFQAI